MSKFKYLLLVIAIIILGSLAFLLSQKLAGTKPTKKMVQAVSSIDEEFSDFLNPLREAVKNDPKNIDKQKQYILGLEKILSVKFIPFYAEELALAYEKLLELEPNQSEHVLKLADLYFNTKQFDKAENYYRQIIDKGDKSQEMRGRLASALSFQGKYDESIKVLNDILTDSPNSFQGLAYLAITHAQMNQKEKALEYGNKALQFAPSAEAKVRFLSFLKKLDPKFNSEGILNINDKIAEYMSEHPILKDKFINSMVKDDGLNIYLQKFPINDMPEFAKEKLFTKLKELVSSEKEIKKIILKDKINDLVLAEIQTGK
jgi:tetratricopeptide (TPR) repeat protein